MGRKINTNMTVRDIQNVLKENDWISIRSSNSHVVYAKNDRTDKIVVPSTHKGTLAPGIIRKIIEQVNNPKIKYYGEKIGM